MKLTDTIKTLLAFLIFFFFTLFLIEIAVRIFAPQERGLFIADPFIRTIHKTNVETTRKTKEYESRIKTNNQGFVGEDFVLKKEENVYRVATLGDSQTEGFDVDFDKSYSSLIEKTLNANNNKQDYQVYNFGMSGSGSIHQFLIYKHYIADYKPDLLIWQIYLANDLADDILLRSNIKDKTSLNSVEAKTGRIRAFLSNNFHSPRFFLRKVEKIKVIGEVLAKLNIVSRQLDHYDESLNYPFVYDVFNTGEETIFTDNFSLTCDFVVDFKNETSKNNTKLIVLLLPAAEQFIDEDWDKILEKFPDMKNKEWNRLQPLEKLQSCLNENDITYADMTQVFDTFLNEGGERMYYLTDPHLNTLGHQIVTEELLEKIYQKL